MQLHYFMLGELLIWLCRSSHWQFFVKKAVVKNFATFTGKHQCWSVFNNDADLQACNKRLQHRFFPVNIVQFLRTPILKNNWVQLLLIMAIWLLCFSRKFDYSEYGKLAIPSKSKNSILNRTVQLFSGVMSVIWLSLPNALFMVDSILCRHASISHPYLKRAVWGALLWIVTCTLYTVGPTTNTILGITGWPTLNAPLCIYSQLSNSECHTPYSWVSYSKYPTLCTARCPTPNILLCLSVPYFI